MPIIKEHELPAAQDTFNTRWSIEDRVKLKLNTIRVRTNIFLKHGSKERTQRDDFFVSTSSTGAVPLDVINAAVWGHDWGVLGVDTSDKLQEDQKTSKPSKQTIFITPIKAEIHQLRVSSGIRFSELLAKRLDSLADATEEEYPDQEPISLSSLKSFLSFLSKTPELDYPSVVLTYSGNIRASWTKSKSEHFAVEFYGSGDVGYVVFAPDSDYPFRVSRTTGSCSSKILMKVVEPFNVLNWAS